MSCAAFVLSVLLAGALPAQAQTWPARPIRMIVNLPPGTPPDQISRAIAPGLGAAVGQPVVVENRVGGDGIIGIEAVAHAQPDGYTLLYTPGFPMVIGLHIHKFPVDVARDLEPVAPTARIGSFLVVRPSLPVSNLAEFISYARANPGKLNYGSGGNGSQGHIAAEMFAHATKVRFTHIPYKGGTDTLAALLGGQIDFTFDVGVAIPQIKAGKLRLIAVASPTRSRIFPEMPTLQESGIDADAGTPHGVYVPVRTSREIIGRLNREIVRVVQTPQVIGVLNGLGADPLTGTAQEFAEMQQRERQKFGEVIRTSNIHAD